MATVKNEEKSSLMGVAGGYLLVVTVLVTVGGLLYGLGGDAVGWPHLPLRHLVAWGLGIWLVLCLCCPLVLLAWDRLLVSQALRVTGGETDVPSSLLTPVCVPTDNTWPQTMIRHLEDHYGFFWRHKVRLLLSSAKLGKSRPLPLAWSRNTGCMAKTRC